jgi:hypothetical protein
MDLQKAKQQWHAPRHKAIDGLQDSSHKSFSQGTGGTCVLDDATASQPNQSRSGVSDLTCPGVQQPPRQLHQQGTCVCH